MANIPFYKAGVKKRPPLNRVLTYPQEGAQAPKRSKYGNVKTVVDGRTFDSKKEAGVYAQLKLMERNGAVTKIELQAPYKLEVNGVKICTYRADFVVTLKDGSVQVWDAKGFRTKEYRLKKKLMKALHNIDIVEA
jgi:hypothetical protein